MALSNYVRALINLKSIIKKVIDYLGIDSENLKFMSSSTVYEDNKGHSCGNNSKDDSYIKAH